MIIITTLPVFNAHLLFETSRVVSIVVVVVSLVNIILVVWGRVVVVVVVVVAGVVVMAVCEPIKKVDNR